MSTYYPLIILNIFVMMPEKRYYFSNVKDIRIVSDKVLYMKSWYNSKNLCECCQFFCVIYINRINSRSVF